MRLPRQKAMWKLFLLMTCLFVLILSSCLFLVQPGPQNEIATTKGHVEIFPLDDMLATSGRPSPCKKTIVLSNQDQIIPKKSDSADPKEASKDTTAFDDVVCIQTEKSVAAVFHMGEVLHTSAFSAIEDFLVNSIPNLSYRIVEKKEVYMEGQYLPANEENNAARETDGNKGNFVWQYGATNLVNPYTTQLVASKNYKTSAFILATANLLLLDKKSEEDEKSMMNMALQTANRVVEYDLPSIVLGIGVQMSFNDTIDMSTVNFDGYDSYNKLLNEIGARQESKSIAVRGDFTERACENSGNAHCLSMGCPSLTISRNANLGAVLKDKWNKVFQRVNGREEEAKSLKVVLALPAMQASNEDYGPAIDLLMSIFAQHDCHFIMQSNYDQRQLVKYTNHTIDDSRLLTYNDHVEPWFDFIKTVDLVLSFRIHGAMAGISNEVPAIVIPTDFRVLELVNAMKLPMLPMELSKEKKYDSLRDIFNDVTPDFDEFENNRRDKIKQYKSILEGIGLEMDPALNAILTQ